jgi:hypothetical protein
MTIAQTIEQILQAIKQILLSSQYSNIFLFYSFALMIGRYFMTYKPRELFKDSVLSLINHTLQTVYIISLIAALSFCINPNTFDINIIYLIFATLILLLSFLCMNTFLILSNLHLFTPHDTSVKNRGVRNKTNTSLDKVASVIARNHDLTVKKKAQEEITKELLKIEEEETLTIFEPILKNKTVSVDIYSTNPIFIDTCPKYISGLLEITNSFFQGFEINVKAVGVDLSTTFIYIRIELGKGIRLESLMKYQNDLARALKEASIHFEVQNGDITFKVKREDRVIVDAGHILNCNTYKSMDILLGLDRNNKNYSYNLASMPHMLIAGTTGSGKSVAMHSIIVGLLTTTPSNLLRFILIDPKQIEFSIYKDLPNLIAPVINCETKSLIYVNWLVQEMERRYTIISHSGERNIEEYNHTVSLRERIPYIVLVVDELGDLMLSSNSKDFEQSLVKLAQKSRAAGIHMILSTQRPSATVFTGLLKSNVPARLACKVASKMESRIILDQSGAENLLGYGDMLFYTSGMDEAVRIQSPYITNDLIKLTVDYCNENLLIRNNNRHIKKTS